MPIAMIFFALLLAAAAMWRFPEYRLAVGAGLLVMATVFAAYFLVNEPAIKTESTTIAPDMLALRDVVIIPDPRFVTLTGQVQNLASQAKLLEMTMELNALDCPTDTVVIDECIVIGADDGAANVIVPAGQLRAFRATFMLRNLPEPAGVLRWHYRIIATRAALQ